MRCQRTAERAGSATDGDESSNKALLVIVALFIQHAAVAQTSQRPPQPDLSYTHGELRFVDVDTNGGDGFRLAGSFELEGPWHLVGAFTALDFNNNVDSTLLELGGGYVWDYSEDFDLVGTSGSFGRGRYTGR